MTQALTAERWQDPQWLAGAHAWIDEQVGRLGLTRTGELEQPHVRLWSTVIRVPTAEGQVWFKANTESLRHEAALVDVVARRRPDAVPPLLALDRESGWMLMADAGETLADVMQREGSLARWLDVLELYAGVQLDLAGDVDDLLALGVPDLRLAVLPEKYERLVEEVGAEKRFRDAAPLVRELTEEMASYGLPELVQHDDLHDHQVFVRDGANLLMDWGDAIISQPFFTLAVTLTGVIAWGLDDEENSEDTRPYRNAYLRPFAEKYDGDLVAAADLATKLGWACRAVSGHVPGDDASTVTRLRMFLDGRPE
jgi:hypothetical protein